MYDVYVPFDDISSFLCYTYNSDGSVIYAFDNMPISNQYNLGKAIFLNNHYNVVDGSYFITDYNCINTNNITNNWFYRKDLTEVLICFMFMLIFFFGIPLFLFSRFFKKKY